MNAKYLYPDGTRFGLSTCVSKVHHIIDPQKHKRSYCMRIFLNDDQITDQPPENTRVCAQCSGIKHRTNIMAQPDLKHPQSKANAINPSHYNIVIDGKMIEGVQIREALFADDMHLDNALKYLLRAGKKADSSYLKDVGKCLWWCARAIMYHGGKVIELPPGAPCKK